MGRLFDILPRINHVRFLDSNATALLQRSIGLTIALQFVDAPTKYISCRQQVTVMKLSALRTHPRPIVQTEFDVFVTTVAQLATWKPFVNLMHDAAILDCNLLQDSNKVTMSKVVHLATPQASHPIEVQVLNEDRVVLTAQGMCKFPLEILS